MRSELTVARVNCSTMRLSGVLFLMTVCPLFMREVERRSKRGSDVKGHASAAHVALKSAGCASVPFACSERKRETPKGAAAAK